MEINDKKLYTENEENQLFAKPTEDFIQPTEDVVEDETELISRKLDKILAYLDNKNVEKSEPRRDLSETQRIINNKLNENTDPEFKENLLMLKEVLAKFDKYYEKQGSVQEEVNSNKEEKRVKVKSNAEKLEEYLDSLGAEYDQQQGNTIESFDFLAGLDGL